jgi:hypothetical protein
MRKMTKRTAAIATAFVLGLGAIGGAAWASGWLIEGKGKASATGADIKEMNADITLDGKVYPGVKRTATALVDNPNEFPVNLTKITNAGNLKAEGGKNPAQCEKELGALGAGAITPDFKTLKIETIKADAKDQPVSMDLTVSKDFPQSCANTKISATLEFQGTSTA